MTKEANASSSVFVNGKLKIDYAAGCAFLDGEELHLTPIEYKLLCLLFPECGQGTDAYLYYAERLGEEAGITTLLRSAFLWRRFGKSWRLFRILRSIFRRISEIGYRMLKAE